MPNKAKPWTIDRIMERVVVSEDDCWLWTGTKDPNGYGVIRVGGRKGKTHPVHRFLDQLRNGPIPERIFVLHHCDVPACVRPDHLWRGTQAENVADMDRKNRGRRYFETKRKLTPEQIDLILTSSKSSRILAQNLPVSARTIRRIRQRNPFALGRRAEE